ncbi:MAG: hypothetical protein N838_23015 [Thiohalocapsa sp. PB-PSB1]|jgi:hypothetical protein|nr:MAG: hypothetical protein N838_23015 [Thiohalocapsa sp. PB-PSB1]HCS88949.1 hypothetical protein [Chromatiaceae bacterium]
MKQTLLQEKYPVFILELHRDEMRFDSVDAICDYFRQCIEAHRCGQFIGVFDHYAHTCSLPEGSVGEGIRAAKNVLFCFGLALPSPRVLAVRPRSIGVAETDQGFVITFMEAPMPIANAAMEDWAESLRIPKSGVDHAVTNTKTIDA